MTTQLALRPLSCVGLILLAAAIAISTAGCTLPTKRVPPVSINGDAKPNVIFILADDLGIGDIGPFGQKLIRTPNLDRMAAEGMRFTQYYAQPVCAPSRAMLLTGKDSGHSAIRGNYEIGGYPEKQELGQLPLPDGTYTIGHLMQSAGYRTAIVGKWGLGGFDGKGLPSRMGFDHSFGYLDQQQAHNFYPTHLWKDGIPYPLDNTAFSAHQKFPSELDKNDPDNYRRYAGKQYSLDVMADDAVSFIRQNRDRPFFLYFAPTTPHVALQVPDADLAQYDGSIVESGPYLGDKGYLPHPRPRAAYAAMITRLDTQIGRILATLKELGLDDDTLVVFTSDNGPTYIGGVDIGYFNSTDGLRGRKDQVYEGGIRVPMIARWPGHVPAGITSAQIAATWDTLPTLAQLLNRRPPGDIDGISILPTLLGQGEQARREFLYWEHHDKPGQQAVRMGRWKAVRIGGKTDTHAAIELYDLELDRNETTDVAAQHPDLIRKAEQIMRSSHTPSPIPSWNFK